MDPDDQPTINELLKQWRRHYTRNTLRTSYYLAHYHYKGVAYSIPPAMKALAKPMIGWPNKAVRALADLSVFEGIDAPETLQTQVDDLVAANTFGVKIQQAIVSAYTHGCSFMTISGDDDDIRITPRAADWSSALWDWGNDRIGAAMTIRDKDKDGYITRFDVWLPGKGLPVPPQRRHMAGRTHRNRLRPPHRRADRQRPAALPPPRLQPHHPPAHGPHRPRTAHPRAHGSDRRILRGTTHMVPRSQQRPGKPRHMGQHRQRHQRHPRRPQRRKPELRQLTQASMQPHSDMLRTVALMVSSETDIPVNDLGITMDNPASAEAMAEAERKLSRTADRQNKRFGESIKSILAMALAAQGADEADIRQLRPIWAPTKEASDAARADWYQKVASTNPAFADSDVGLSRAGLTWDEINAHRAYEKQQRTQDAIDELRAKIATAKTDTQEAAANGQQQPAAEQPQPGAA